MCVWVCPLKAVGCHSLTKRSPPRTPTEQNKGEGERPMLILCVCEHQAPKVHGTWLPQGEGVGARVVVEGWPGLAWKGGRAGVKSNGMDIYLFVGLLV